LGSSPGKPYTVLITPAAVRELRKLERRDQQRIGTAIDSLPADPPSPGVEKLQGVSDFYRIRVRDFRIIYTVNDKARRVHVARIGHRREVYRA
jgi:mRNA interferase RelE/StbE